MTSIHIAFLLLAGHYLSDYALQGEAMAREKSRKSKSELQKHVPWYHWLAAHAAIHGACVLLVTGSVLLGALETCAHFAIDFGKCEGWFGIKTDQALHFACKAAWLFLLLLNR